MLRTDTIFTYARTATCRVQIYDGLFGTPVVVASELDDNSGLSITNAANHLAASVMKHGLPHRIGSHNPMLWIEHYADAALRAGQRTALWPSTGSRFTRVEFDSYEMRPWHVDPSRLTAIGSPRYHAISMIEVEMAIGRTLRDEDLRLSDADRSRLERTTPSAEHVVLFPFDATVSIPTRVYRGCRTPLGALVTTTDQQGTRQLRHVVRHAPNGFAWGIPALPGADDLALMLLVDALRLEPLTALTGAPCYPEVELIYSLFSAEIVTVLNDSNSERHWELRHEEIVAFYRRHQYAVCERHRRIMQQPNSDSIRPCSQCVATSQSSSARDAH